LENTMPADQAPRSTAAAKGKVDPSVGDAPAGVPSTLVVAIDGPSGSGKSTVARGVARALGLRYLDTGATYRALTWAVLDRGVNPEDTDPVIALAATVKIEVSTEPDDLSVEVDGRDVASAIRGSGVTHAVSAVSAIPQVRERLVALQRSVIGNGGIVVEGRDIGTVVCPEAPVKIFLTASSDARATRRWADPVEAAAASRDVEAVRADLARRDQLDSTRITSPLTRATDAVSLDSTAMDADAVIAAILDIVAERTGMVPTASTLAQLHDSRVDHISGERR
jgi:CMP/dCMP kinase